MGTQSINFDNIDDVKYNGTAMDKVYLNSTLLWERAPEITKAEAQNYFSGGVAVAIGSTRNIFQTVNRYGGGSSGGRTEYTAHFHYIQLPKPNGFKLGSTESCAVRIHDNSVANSSSMNVSYKTQGSFINGIRYTSRGDIRGCWPRVYSNMAPKNQWYAGKEQYDGFQWVGASFQFPTMYFTHTWQQWRSTGTGNGFVFGFYNYDLDKPCIGIIEARTALMAAQGDIRNINGNAWYNWAHGKKYFIGARVELIKGGHDPMWPHTKYGFTQRNPKRGAL